MGKYDLACVDGNAFSIIVYVIRAMEKCGYTVDEINAYQKRAMSGDYDNLLIVSRDAIAHCNELSKKYMEE